MHQVVQPKKPRRWWKWVVVIGLIKLLLGGWGIYHYGIYLGEQRSEQKLDELERFYKTKIQDILAGMDQSKRDAYQAGLEEGRPAGLVENKEDINDPKKLKVLLTKAGKLIYARELDYSEGSLHFFVVKVEEKNRSQPQTYIMSCEANTFEYGLLNLLERKSKADKIKSLLPF